MLRRFLLIAFTVSGPIILRAQQTATDSLLNPFSTIAFANQPIGTAILQGSYANSFTPLTEDHVLILKSINKVYGLDVKKFHYSIALKLDGSSQIFDVPCCDEDLYHLLSAKTAPISRLKLKCVIYRFYTIDGTTNFFYIDKATTTGI